MKKIWENAEIEELTIRETANGLFKNDDYDDTWVQINGFYYKGNSGSDAES